MSRGSSEGVLAACRRVSDGVNHLVLVVCVIMITVMFSISVAGIAHQAFAGSALSWSNSLARLFVPWIAMLSLTVAFKRGEHIAMGMLVTRAPALVLRLAQGLGLIVIALFGFLLFWFGIPYFLDSTQLFMISDSWQISHHWVAAAVPLSGLILCVHLVDGVALLGDDMAAVIDEAAS
jgi:TRAP-type C4-dicarboxylate transport system permease small subunit